MTYVDVWRLEYDAVNRPAGVWDESTNGNWYECGLVGADKNRLIDEAANISVLELESLGTAITLSKGNTVNDRTTIRCLAVNAEPFKWMLGLDNGHDGDGKHYWTPQLTGRKPSISVYKANDYLKYRARGIKLQQLDWALEQDVGGVLTYTMSGPGGTHGTYAPAVTNSGYYSSLQTPIGFKPTFSWNSTGFEFMKVGGSIQQKLTPLIGPSGYYQDITENSSMHFSISILLKPTQDISAIDTDRYAGTERAFEIKMYQTATTYIKLTGTAICADIMDTSIQGHPTVYAAIFVGKGDFRMTDWLV